MKIKSPYLNLIYAILKSEIQWYLRQDLCDPYDRHRQKIAKTFLFL